MSAVEVATGFLTWFEFDREHVGTSRERWTLYGKSISHVAAASPAAFVALACVLRGAANDYGCDGFTARRLSSGDTLLTMAGGAKAIVPSTIASGIAHTIDALIAESQRVISARHERALDALCALGEAVATVAQSRLIARLMERGEVAPLPPRRERPYYLLRAEGASQRVLCLYRRLDRAPHIEPVAEWIGELEDTAPLGVARLIEEAQR